MTLRASSASPRTNASSASRTIFWASSARRGRYVIGLMAGSRLSSLTRSPPAWGRAEVARGRLHLGDQLDHVLVDLDLHLVDAVVVGDDLFGHGDVEIKQRTDRLLDRVLHHRAHAEEMRLDL